MTGWASAQTATSGCGRFAPSPSSRLHLGNLRTALLSWLFARTSGRGFVVRIEDLDTARSKPEMADRHLAELAALGLDWDGPVVWQSARGDAYAAAIDRLTAAGLTYECFCTRREIAEAASAPHAPPGAYPGTCRDLPAAERERRRAAGRRPALRLRARTATLTVDDAVAGPYTGTVDDLVLRRGDGTVAYNLAVVVDDAAAGIDQVVRGDDLLPSTPRQVHLAHLLELPVPRFCHVPLVLGPRGRRLSKRDGAVTLEDLVAAGTDAGAVRTLLAVSLGLADPGEAVSPAELLARFDPHRLPTTPWVYRPAPAGSDRPVR